MRLKILANIRTLRFGVYCHVSLWHLSCRRCSGCKYFVVSLDIVKFIVTVSSVGESLLQRIGRRSREAGLNFSYVSFLFLCCVSFFSLRREKVRSLMAFWHSENVSHFFFTSCVSVTMLTRLWNMNWSNPALTLKLRAISIINSKINIFIFLYLSTNSHNVKFDSVANGEIPQYNQFKLHKQRPRTLTTIFYIFFRFY